MTTGQARGVFISFEGGDGAGKTTQIRMLADRFRASGRDVVTTREPGGSPGAEMIRQLLVEGPPERWSPMSEALLMYAARADHLQRTILPALARGAIVISDRFADSTMAYQGLAGALGEGKVRALEQLVVAEHLPDVTIILDIPVESGLARAGSRAGKEDRFEAKGAEYQAAVRNAFVEIAAMAPNRCALVDAVGNIDTVATRVWEAVKLKAPALTLGEGGD